MDSPARTLWKQFGARSLRHGAILETNRTSTYEALYSPFMVSLASGGDLPPESFHRHVAGVRQILEAMATVYAWAEESTSIRGNKSAQAAICGLRQGVEEEHTYLSSQLEKWGVDASKYSSEPVEYCQFITAKFPFCNDAHYVAFLLASTITFISLSAYLARKLKRVAHPKYLHWIERFASESFQASCMQNEQVLNDICKDANLSLNSGKVGGFGIEIHYRKAMQLSVNFFARHVTIEECCIVPLTKEHNPARELILVACALDSPCCSYMKCEAYTKDFTCLVLNIIPIVKVGFVHENVRNALSQLADFQVKATGIKDIDEVNIGQSFTDLLLTIGSSKNTCNARVHVVAALYDNYDNKLKSAVSSECMDKCILHTNLESSTVKLDLFREISRNTNNEKLLSIYVGNGIDDLGCLLEADIGIVLNPCPELLFLSTQFGVSFVPLWEVTVAKQKQMREGIHFLWKSRTGTLYVVKTLDEITAFMYGAFKIDCTPETKNASGPYESSSLGNLFSSLPKPKSASQSAYFSLVENMRFEKQQAEKPEIYLTSATPRKPPKKEKLPLALILPKPKNLNLSVDSSNVQKRELEKKQTEQADGNQKVEKAEDDIQMPPAKKEKLPLALLLPKPKNLNPFVHSSNVEKRELEKQQARQADGNQKFEEEKDDIQMLPSKKEKLPLALLLPKPKNLNPSVDSSNVEKKEQAEQQDVNQKEEDAVEDGNKQVEKEEDMQADGKTK